jgi:hypothetical protein
LKPFRFERIAQRLMCAALACMAIAPALAAPGSVEPFDAGTWKALQAGVGQPTAVVFTTTDCGHCPAVIDSLATRLKAAKGRAQLAVVVMDVPPGENDEALKTNAHYRRADRLLAFAGQAAALRYGVDPRWPGVTPYVVLLRPKTPAKAIIGPPAAADVSAWLKTQP